MGGRGEFAALVISAALNHATIETTQRDLSVDDNELKNTMQKCDFTCGPRQKRGDTALVSLPAPIANMDSAA